MYFSVTYPIKIAGKVYKPCVCYELPSYLENTVRDLASKGKATIYTEKRFFCNGALVEKETKVAKKSTKKVEKTTVEKEAEELGLPKEIEESEGF